MKLNYESSMARFAVLIIVWAACSLSAQAQAENARVWLQFNPGRGGAVKAAVEQAGGEVHYLFDNINALATTVPVQAIQGLQNNPNILLIEEDPVREMYGQTIPYGLDLVQAPAVWTNENDTGNGIKVGVIDSGVYTAHEDLAGVPMSGIGLSGGTDWSTDGCSHGTHVVGTIVAQNNSLGVAGVAPGVQIFMVRVFGDDCGWAYSSTLVDAAYKCLNAGVKIISMSLGGSTKSSTEEAAFQDIYNKDVLCVAAAGNGGNSAYSYPAAYYSVVSVAAVDQDKNVASFSQFNDDVEVAAPGVGVLSTVPFTTAELTVNSQSYVAQSIENAALKTVSGTLVDGGLGDTTNPSWSGKVVLVQRGTISFAQKVLNVQNSGGVAAVIYNNVQGGFSGTLGTGNSSTIPAISITQEDGTYIRANELNTLATVSTHAPLPGNGYAYYDGTSMATPHVSGVAALVWGYKSGLHASQVRAALRGSAMDLGARGRDNYYGYGLVQAEAAINFLLTGDTSIPTLTAGPTGTANKGGSFTITWSTGEASDSVVTFTSPGLATYVDKTLTQSHSMSFRGQKGVTYTYWISSSDSAGNMLTAGPKTVKP